jgi:hypothetical protein
VLIRVASRALAGMVLPPIYFVTAPALAFQSKFLRQAHGYTPAAVAFPCFVGGLVSTSRPSSPVGRVSDAVRRKPAALLMIALTAAGTLASIARASASGVLAGWLTMVAAYLGLDVMLEAPSGRALPDGLPLDRFGGARRDRDHRGGARPRARGPALHHDRRPRRGDQLDAGPARARPDRARGAPGDGPPRAREIAPE